MSRYPRPLSGRFLHGVKHFKYFILTYSSNSTYILSDPGHWPPIDYDMMLLFLRQLLCIEDQRKLRSLDKRCSQINNVLLSHGKHLL